MRNVDSRYGFAYTIAIMKRIIGSPIRFVRRITGISTPFVGVTWSPKDTEANPSDEILSELRRKLLEANNAEEIRRNLHDVEALRAEFPNSGAARELLYEFRRALPPEPPPPPLPAQAPQAGALIGVFMRLLRAFMRVFRRS